MGAIDFKDALRIVRQRGLLMKAALPESQGKMSAVTNLDIRSIEFVCKQVSTIEKPVVVSNYNAYNQYVISGLAEPIELATQKLLELGARVIPLNVSAPFHSPYMQSAAEEFRKELQNYTFKDFTIPVISNIDALPYREASLIPAKLVEQLIAPVQWTKTVEFLYDQDIHLAIELGPKNVLKNLIKATSPQIQVYSFDKVDDRNSLNENIVLFINKCMAITVCTKNNSNLSEEAYKTNITDNYFQLQQIIEEFEASTVNPLIEHAQKAYDLLLVMLKAKNTPNDELESRINELKLNPISHFISF